MIALALAFIALILACAYVAMDSASIARGLYLQAWQALRPTDRLEPHTRALLDRAIARHWSA